MVFFLPERPEISDRDENEPGDSDRLLEGDRKRQGDSQGKNGSGWYEENAGFLQRKSSQR